MIHVPEGRNLERKEPDYVSIDVDGEEIGHLVIQNDGQVMRLWAMHIEGRRLVRSRRPCLSAAKSLKRRR